jgi:hypothetical protein
MRPTEGIGSGLSPTPQASDGTTGSIIGKNDTFRQTKGLPRKINQNGKDGSVGLGRLVQMLPTPQANDWKNGQGNQFQVSDAVRMIPTPMAQDWKGSSKSKPRDTVDSLVETGATKGQTGIKTGLKLQPAFVEWMMGYPQNWTDLNCPNQDIGQIVSKD